MATQPINVSALLLDMANPRVEATTSQRDEMQRLLDDQEQRIVALAEHIVSNGLNPIDGYLVMKDATDTTKFIVLEGNRRVLALKILTNPSVLGDLTLPDTRRKRLEELAKEFKNKPIKTIDCHEVKDREEAKLWIQLRHMGENEGRGVVQWGGVATARWRGDDPALQALAFVADHGNLDDDEATLVRSGSFPITTLRRLIDSVDVRKLLGFDVKSKRMVSGLPADQLMRPLRRIVLDLATKAKTVTELKLKEQQIAYVKGFGAGDAPDLTKAGSVRPIDQIGKGEFTGKKPSPKKKRPASPATRPTMVPRGLKLNITSSKVDQIYNEIHTLRLVDWPNACAVLLRVFLELSVDQYLRTHKLPNSFKEPKSGRTIEKKLRQKLQDAVDHLVKAGGRPKKQFDGVLRAVDDKNSPLHMDLLHAYVHCLFQQPSERDLRRAWDLAQPLFENIWP